MSGFSSLSLTLLLSRRERGDSSGLLLLEGESRGEGSPSVGSVFRSNARHYFGSLDDTVRR